MITLNDISSKVFSDQELGYSKDEVDDFLDAIATDYAALIKENRALKKKIEEQEEQGRTRRDRLGLSVFRYEGK